MPTLCHQQLELLHPRERERESDVIAHGLLPLCIRSMWTTDTTAATYYLSSSSLDDLLDAILQACNKHNMHAGFAGNKKLCVSSCCQLLDIHGLALQLQCQREKNNNQKNTKTTTQAKLNIKLKISYIAVFSKLYTTYGCHFSLKTTYFRTQRHFIQIDYLFENSRLRLSE